MMLQSSKAEQIAWMRQLCADPEIGLRVFVEQSWKQVEPETPYRDNWHIHCICEHLQAVTRGEIENLLINIPPGCMKSILTSVMWPAWEWGPTGQPHLRYLCGSYDQALSTRDNLRTRWLIESRWYQDHWPHVQLHPDQNEKTRYNLTGGGWRIGTSVGGRGTGEHPHRKIVDDPHNVKQAESDVERQQALDWQDGTLATRGKALKARTVIIMQRLHERDSSGHVMGKSNFKDKWVHLCLPMRYEKEHAKPMWGGWSDPRKEDGELLWPSLFDEQAVSELEEDMGPMRSAGQLQQRPAPAEGARFKREHFRYYSREKDSRGRTVAYITQMGRRVPVDQCWRFIVADTAYETKEENDWTVRLVIDVERSHDERVGNDRAGAMFIADLWRRRAQSPDVVAQLRADYAAFRPIFIGIESVSDGGTVLQWLAREGLPVMRMKYGDKYRIPDKGAKAVISQLHMAQGKVHVEADAPWREGWETEHLLFPNVEFDDQVDVTGMACHLAYNQDLWPRPRKKKYAPGTFGALAGHDKLGKPKPGKPVDPFARR